MFPFLKKSFDTFISPSCKMPTSPFFRRLCIFLAMLLPLGIVCLAVLRKEPVPAPVALRPPLDFELVWKRFAEISLFGDKAEVDLLLGPQTGGAPEHELEDGWERAEHSNRGMTTPIERYWESWSDPNDQDRWVAILYAGSYPKYIVYWKLQKASRK